MTFFVNINLMFIIITKKGSVGHKSMDKTNFVFGAWGEQDVSMLHIA